MADMEFLNRLLSKKKFLKGKTKKEVEQIIDFIKSAGEEKPVQGRKHGRH